MENITSFKVNSDTVAKARKALKEKGWVSAHYLTRHGVNVEKLRKLAKSNQLKAATLVNGFTTTWYYREADVAQFKVDN